MKIPHKIRKISYCLQKEFLIILTTVQILKICQIISEHMTIVFYKYVTEFLSLAGIFIKQGTYILL